MHPEILAQLARGHRDDLLREAEAARLGRMVASRRVPGAPRPDRPESSLLRRAVGRLASA